MTYPVIEEGTRQCNPPVDGHDADDAARAQSKTSPDNSDGTEPVLFCQAGYVGLEVHQNPHTEHSCQIVHC